jgi:hypothetical protein
MHNISHKGFSWMAALAIGALVFFTLSFSFVQAGDDSADTSSTDTSSSNNDYSNDTSGNYSGGSVTGTYTQYDDGTSSLGTSGCGNVTSCDSVSYDNGLTIYDYSIDTDSGVTSGLVYVDGQYVYAELQDAGDGTETWVYSAPVESGDGGFGNNNNDQNTDNTDTGTTNNTTNTTNTPQVSCSFSFACFPPPTTTTTTTSSPCFTALCTGEPTSTTNSNSNNNPNNNPPNIPQQPANPTATIDASPRLVRSTGSTELTWSSTGARSCAVTYAGNTIFTGPSGSQTLSNISGTRLYKLDCVNAGGVHATASVTVSVIPAWREN